MVAEADSSAGSTADDIALMFTYLDADLNSIIFNGQLLGTNSHSLLNFCSDLRVIHRYIYWNCGLHIVEHL